MYIVNLVQEANSFFNPYERTSKIPFDSWDFDDKDIVWKVYMGIADSQVCGYTLCCVVCGDDPDNCGVSMSNTCGNKEAFDIDAIRNFPCRHFFRSGVEIEQVIDQCPICRNKLIKPLPPHEDDAVDAMSDDEDWAERVEEIWNRLIIITEGLSSRILSWSDLLEISGRELLVNRIRQRGWNVINDDEIKNSLYNWLIMNESDYLSSGFSDNFTWYLVKESLNDEEYSYYKNASVFIYNIQYDGRTRTNPFHPNEVTLNNLLQLFLWTEYEDDNEFCDEFVDDDNSAENPLKYHYYRNDIPKDAMIEIIKKRAIKVLSEKFRRVTDCEIELVGWD